MKKILPWVSSNGKIVSDAEAKISVFDAGFLFGYGFFTTLKVRERIPLFFEKHQQRLKKSASKLSFHFLQDCFTNLRNDVIKIIEKNDITDGAIRITITKNWQDSSTIVIHATTIEKKIQTVCVSTVADERDVYKTIKMTYRVPHLLAMQKAQEQGSQDALFTHNSVLIESTYANIYVYTPENHIITPPIAGRGLSGISRQVLLEQLAIREEEVPIMTQNPMVLVSSLGMRIVEKINGKKIRQDPVFVSQIKNALDIAEKKYIAVQK